MIGQSQTLEIKSTQYFMRVQDVGTYLVGPARTCLDKEECMELAKVLPSEIIDGDVYFDIPKDNAELTKPASRSVQCCAYNATKDYLESLMGRKMDSSDQDWYKGLGQVETTGLPYEHTISVLHELVRPYGIGVSEVILKPGSNITAEQKVWMVALGCNPLAVGDRTTSNEAFAAMTGLDCSEYRFRYSSSVNGPAVMTEDYGAARSHAAGGGHATYMAPRRSTANSVISIKYDYLRDIEYKSPIPPLVELPLSIQPTLMVSKCKMPDGQKTIGEYLKEAMPKPEPKTYPLFGGHLPPGSRNQDPHGWDGQDEWRQWQRAMERHGISEESVYDSVATEKRFWRFAKKFFNPPVPQTMPAVVPMKHDLADVLKIPKQLDSTLERVFYNGSSSVKAEELKEIARAYRNNLGQCKLGDLQELMMSLLEDRFPPAFVKDLMIEVEKITPWSL